MRWVWESLPGWSTSKAWWACLSVDTLSPRATMRGMTLARSVVLPEPLQPASPMMRMRHYSSPERVRSHPQASATEMKAPGGARRALWISRFFSQLFGRLHSPSRRLCAGISGAEFPLGPQVVVLLCPIDVDRAIPHRLERAFHPDGADIDVGDHGGNEQQRHDAVDDLGQLHVRDVSAVEREHQEIAAYCHRGAAEHHDPIDHLLTRIKTIGRRMLVADHAAAFLQPFDIDPVRNVPGYPHQEDYKHADREREAQVVVGVFRPLRPGGERLRPDEGQQQRFAERDVESGNGEDDEAGRRHPVHEALEGGEAYQHPPGAARCDADHAASQIEENEERKHAENGDGADPAQRDLMEVAPIPARGLLDRAGLLVGNRAAAADSVELVEKLILLHRARSRVDRAVRVALLGARGSRHGDDQRERHRTDDETDAAD